MKIAIAGGGIVGSYLAHSLSDHEVEVYEKRPSEAVGEDCAWGTSIRMLEKYSRNLNRAPSDYIKHICREFLSGVFANRDAVIFDKNKFIMDFLEKSGANVNFEREVERGDLKGFDLAIDATGCRRSLLPSPRNGLEENWICPCFQAEVESHEIPKDFYFELKEVGLLWVFPQGGNRAKVGCGDFVLNPRAEVKDYLSGKDYETFKEIGANVRVIPPSRSRPFYADGDPPAIGVGESIGTVSPFSGEGILPSLICADIFLDALKEGESLEEAAQIYEAEVLREYAWADKWFKLIKSVRFGSLIGQLWHLARAPVPSWACGNVSKLSLALREPFR